ncbi:MAG TPA: aldo/keto reductase [Caulobacteraceae bacterium]|jgi:aryl-alcohol dehydrogenase (NADP+)|nr:aldo/keto reductase [Caulobacteraceae bacterium]
MDYVRLGNTGLKVSRLCLGCMTYGSSKWRSWVLDEDEAMPFFKKAIEAGINFFDTADVYSQGESERVTGKALKTYAKRHEVVLATKVNGAMGADPNNRGLSRKHILDGIDRSLSRLGVDYVDLYQIHRFDYETPIEETLEALNDVVRAGKARYIGASSMYAWQFMKMLATSRANGWTPFVSMQPQYNLVYREEEREMLPLCLDQGVGVIPWSPLARGFLAGGRSAPGEGNTERARTDEFSARLYYKEADNAVVDALSAAARERGVSNMQLALAWVLKNPAITSPIIGTSKAHHLDDALAGLQIKLTDAEVKALEAPYEPKRVADHA